MRPSSVLGLSPTSPAALAVDLGVALRAEMLELETGTGEYWWLSLLRRLGLAGEATAEEPRSSSQYDWSNPKWL